MSDVKTDIQYDKFVTLPVKGVIYTGVAANYQLIDISINHCVYIKAVELDGETIPIIPINEYIEEERKERFREWITVACTFMYDLHPLNDEIAFLIFGIASSVWNSDVSDDIKRIFRQLAYAMLWKKRKSFDSDDLTRVKQGFLPGHLTNQFNVFKKHSCNAMKKLDITASPIRLWYEVCRVFGPKVLEAQRTNKPYDNDMNIKMPSYKVVQLT